MANFLKKTRDGETHNWMGWVRTPRNDRSTTVPGFLSLDFKVREHSQLGEGSLYSWSLVKQDWTNKENMMLFVCNESVFFNLIKLPFFCSPAIQSFEKKSALEYLNRRLLHWKRIKDKHIVWKFNCVLVPNNRVRYYQKAFRCRHVIERGGTSATNLWTHNSALLNEI